MNHHQIKNAEQQTIQAMVMVAKLVVSKARMESKSDPSNDNKRFKLQDAIGRLHRLTSPTRG
tara:strand:+ start:3208 stop:3393 length:186 start_codon:yes stop_codon:yes gene_type:complete